MDETSALAEDIVDDVTDDEATSHAVGVDVEVDRNGDGDGTDEPTDPDRRVDWLAIAAVAAPFAVLAVAIFVVGGDYKPTSDHAGIETHVRGVGFEGELVGLYSRDRWSHPGPLFFYLAAPIYWLTGRASIGLDLAAVLINLAAVVGMALVARRRGGTALMLCTLVGCALTVRSLGADFLHDPWNTYTPTLAYGLLLLLTWSVLAGDRWALPLAVAVFSFAAQTHVGFMLLGLPLVAGAGLVLALRERRAAARTVAASTALLGLLWLPPVLDVVLNEGANARRLIDWFADPGEDTHSLLQGWRVMSGQFELWPEWLSGKLPPSWGTGESPFLYVNTWPVLLVPVAVAMVALWRRRQLPFGRELVVVVGVSFLLGVVAVWRTAGMAYDYRLRWTWMPTMLVVVAAAWVAWRAIADRWPSSERRLLVPAALVALAGLAVANGVAAAGTDTINPRDAEIMDAFREPVVEEARAVEGDGAVVLDGRSPGGILLMRGLMLQLDRAGVEARYTPNFWILREYPLHREGPEALQLVVVTGDFVAELSADPEYRLIAEWQADSADLQDEAAAETAELEAEYEAGRFTQDEYLAALAEVMGRYDFGDCGNWACEAAVFAYEPDAATSASRSSGD